MRSGKTVKQITEYLVKHATITIACEPEDVDVRGNALASGDDAEDRKQEQWVYDQLASGNQWAWCFVKVTARYEGFTGRDTLGCCSYLSEADFTASGYREDMIREACLDLANQLFRSEDALTKIRLNARKESR